MSNDPDNKRFNAIVVTLISMVTVVSAITAFLQNDASSRSNTAIRSGQDFAVQQMEAALQVQQRENFDTFVYQQWSGESWERSLALQKTDNVTATQDADRLANLMQLTASFSPMTSPPYLDDPLNGSPDLARYYAEHEYEPTYLRERRDAATTEGNAWSSKASTYVTVLTLLAVSLFLFGLATTIGGRVRNLFVGLGIVIAFSASGWMIVNALTTIPTRSDAAMQALARGQVAVSRAATLRGWGRMTDALPFFQSGIEELNKAIEIEPAYAAALSERASAYIQAGEQRVFDREDAAQFLQYAIDDYQAAIDHGDDSVNALWNLGWAYYLLGDQPQSLDWTNRAIDKAPEQIGLYLNRAVSQLALGQRAEAFNATQAAFDKAVQLKISSANYYFRAAIHDTTKQVRAFPNRDLEALLKDFKEKYVALRYRKGTPAQPTGVKVSQVTFYKTLDANDVLSDPATAFEAQTEKVYLGFEYTGWKPGSELEALVYYVDQEDDTLAVLEKLALPQDGTGWIRIASPFINSGGLTSGQYRVDVHVEGELVATGEFEVQ
jgi:tetratricopeptide (TPR) repeat protein